MTYPNIYGGETPPPPGPPQYPQHGVWAVPPEVGRGFQISSLICGIVGVVLGLIPLFFLFSWVLGILALVMGFIAWKRREQFNFKTTMAKWGVVLGAVSFVLGCIGFVIVSNAFDRVDEGFECLDRATTAEEMDACNEP
jgi:hypothetical protein